MADGVGFPFPSLLLNEGRTYGQPEVVLISLPQTSMLHTWLFLFYICLPVFPSAYHTFP